MANRLKFFIFIAFFVILSLQYSNIARGYVGDATNSIIEVYLGVTKYIKETITEHFDQKDEIQRLRAQNSKLERSSLLARTYASKLNHLLRANKKEQFSPKTELVKSISYEGISNYNRVWIDMNDFNKSKIYGLIYKGSTAGIVVAKNDRALGLLQGDDKCIFSVSVGKHGFPGVAMGKGEFINVRYIPLWMEPKKGDKVVTSGLDNIFVEGVLVGEVVDVRKEESYQTAIVKPNVKVDTPSFFYVIK